MTAVASPFRRGAEKRLAAFERLIEGVHGTPEDTLGNHPDPLDEAVYIILSFQTDLARFGLTWASLKTAFPTWEQLEKARDSQVAFALREGGLHRQKARTIKQLLAAVRRAMGRLSLEELRGMNTDAAEQLLLRLPGLSWKGARCVLLYSLDRDVLPVDSNTFRILKRAGVLRADAVYRRRSLHDAVQDLVPPDRRRSVHVNLVVHGQRTCVPLAPRCDGCAARPACARFGVARTKQRTRLTETTG